ncbi:MAG: MFS transporter [Vicinamibacterales bacterium]
MTFQFNQFTSCPNRPAPLSSPSSWAGFTAFLDLYATQPLLPLLMRVFDASHFDVSLTVTAATLAVALAAPVVGRVADVVGRKRVIVGSAFILAIATALCATATNLTQFIVWRFVQGLMTPGVFAITIAYIHEDTRTGTPAARRRPMCRARSPAASAVVRWSDSSHRPSAGRSRSSCSRW